MRIKDVKPLSFVAQLRCDRCGTEAQHNDGGGFNKFLLTCNPPSVPRH